MSHLERVQTSLDIASREIHDLLDIASIPENSELSQKVEMSLELLNQVLSEIEKQESSRSLIAQDGYLVYSNREKDIRTWTTSRGPISKLFLDKGRFRDLWSSTVPLMVPENTKLKRVLTKDEFESLLNQIENVPVLIVNVGYSIPMSVIA
jgi:hypothetical protein